MMNKILNFILVVLLVNFAFTSCGEKKAETPESTEPAEVVVEDEDPFAIEEKAAEPAEVASGIIDGINAKQIFKQSCAVCHGVDGKLGANGSKDLTQSILTIDEKVNMIKNGKGLMIAFEAVLSAEEINAVAKYTEQLKG
jgi:mono/diheme cytochrome c family protein